MRTKKLSTLLSIYIYICMVNMLLCGHARGSQRSLTVIGDQALAGSEQQVDPAASCLDQLDGPSVRDALCGLAVDLHYLISNL